VGCSGFRASNCLSNCGPPTGEEYIVHSTTGQTDQWDADVSCCWQECWVLVLHDA
jgi:hypothetical protein